MTTIVCAGSHFIVVKSTPGSRRIGGRPRECGIGLTSDEFVALGVDQVEQRT